MIEGVDVFIPCAPKDAVKLPFVLDSIDRCLSDVGTVHIVTPNGIPREKDRPWKIVYHHDREIINYDWSKMKFRPTWIRQQFLKLFQTVTNDWYLVMDADRFLNHPQRLFDGLKPYLFLSSREQNWPQYFEYTQKMLGIGRVYPHSFLSEVTLYHRPTIIEMLARAGLNVRQWLDKTAEIENVLCVPGDAEIYGNYCAAYHPTMYEYKVLKEELRGKYIEEGEWTKDELRAYVNEMRTKDDVDMFCAHSWHD